MSERNDETRREALLTRLLRTSGRGPTASPEAKTRVYAAVRERWQATLPKRAAVASIRPAARAWVSTRGIALAAMVALAAVIVYQSQAPRIEEPASFGSIAKLDGNVAIRHSGEQRSVRVTDAVAVHVGDTLVTDGGAKVALELENGASLRVNSGSEVEMVAADRVALRSGTVYFDANGETVNASFAVETPFGSVRHVGTQFEASLVGNGLRIRVREGAVMFNSPAHELIASAGEMVRIEGAGPPQRDAFATDDDAWQWVEDLAILPVAKEYSLPDVLIWIGRQTGRDVRFADAAVQARVQTIVVYDLGNLTPEETLAVLRGTTAFEYRETDDGLLVVSSTR